MDIWFVSLLSLGPFITCFIGIVFLAAYLYVILYHSNHHFIYGAKIIFAGIFIIFLRMCIPVNFSFTYTIKSNRLLLPLVELNKATMGLSDFEFLNIGMMLIYLIAVIKLIMLFIRRKRLYNYLDEYIVTNRQQYPRLFDAVERHCTKPIRIAVLHQNISPAISGTLHPILIFPDSLDSFSEEELDWICLHEIRHYKNRDLWARLVLDIISCLHWWNPLVYLMRREYALALELSNDYSLMDEHSRLNYLNYADLLLKVAKKTASSAKTPSGVTPLVRSKNSDLRTRISFILKNPATQKKKKLSALRVHTALICTVTLLSLILVVEPVASLPPHTDDGTFYMNQEDTYFIHTSEGYEIYVNGNYKGTVVELPEDFKNYKIYTQGEQIK